MREKINSKHSSHSYSSSKLKYDSRKQDHGVKDGRVFKKPGGLGWSTRKHYPDERSHKDRPLLSPRYANDESKPRPISPNAYEEAYEAKTHTVEKPKNFEERPKVYEGKPKLYEEKPKLYEERPKTTTEKPRDNSIEEKSKNDEKLQVAKANKKSNSASSRPARYSELSPLMAKMVEDELKDIMISVWQTLPDDVHNEPEKQVVDKLKNEAGDDLRNTIGLNVTKRLLNVHNGIFVKVNLHDGILVSESDKCKFAKKYGLIGYRYFGKNTYGGRLCSWPELDQLYSVENLRCGKVRASLSLEYQFMTCPPNLKTVFDGKQDYNSKEIEKEAAKRIVNLQSKAFVTADKVLAEEAKKEIAKKDNKISDAKAKVEVKVEENKTKSPNSGKNAVASKTTVEPKGVEKKPSPTKPSETKTVKEITQPKQNEIKDTNTTKAEPTKTVVNKPIASTNSVKNEVKTATKVEPAKTTTNKTPVAVNTPKKQIAPKLTEKQANVVAKPLATVSAKRDGIPVNEKTPDVKVKVEPTNTVAQSQTKTVANELAKAIPKEVTKEIAKVVSKEPAKVVSKEPAKVISKEPAKVISKEPATVVSKEPAKTIPKEAAKVVSKEPVKSLPKEATKVIPKEPAKVAPKQPANSVPKEAAKVLPKEPAKVTPKQPANSVPKEAAKVLPKEPAKVAPKQPANSSKSITANHKEIVKPKPAGVKRIDTKTAPKAPTKAIIKDTRKAPVISPKKNTKIESQGNDFDELDDHDILAMLSGGIILDECSGSDEE